MKIKLNMKKLFLLFTLLLSINIQAWNLEKVGNIKAKTWNELFEGFTSNEIYVSAGSNGEISNVRLNFDMGLGRFSVTYVFNGTDTSQVKGLNNLRDYLDKSIRWTEIAKKNSAETQKEIGNNCGTNEVSCSATFFSNNDALPMKSFLPNTVTQLNPASKGLVVLSISFPYRQYFISIRRISRAASPAGLIPALIKVFQI